MKKRFLSLLLALALLCGLLPLSSVSVRAYSETDIAYPVEGGNIYFDKETGTVTSSDLSVTRADIPEQIDGTTVRIIGTEAFYEHENLVAISIPKTLTAIKTDAFYACSALHAAYIPDLKAYCAISFEDTVFGHATSAWLSDPGWGDYYLGETLIEDLVIPDGVTEIGANAFAYSNRITSITIPEGVTFIGANAFLHSRNLTDITIPKTITKIDKAAFQYCATLENVYINDLAAWCAIDFELNYEYSSFWVKSNPLHYADNLFICGELTTDIVIPDQVSDIGYAFRGTNITNIHIGKGMTSIGADTFSQCTKLTSVTISDSVTSIGYSAFSYCSSLTSVTIPDSVTSIGNYAFSYCSSLMEINVAKGNKAYTSENGVLFDKDKTTLHTYPGGKTEIEYVIPNGVTSIGDCAFNGCRSLISVTIPDSVTSIGDHAFYGCSGLTNVSIPDSVTSIGFLAFTETGCYNDENNWQDGVFYLDHWLLEANDDELSAEYMIIEGTLGVGNCAFLFCSSLTSVTIPDSVTSIGDSAFSYCSSLTDVTIPDSVTSIGDSAFNYTGYYYDDSNWQDGVLYLDHWLLDTNDDELSAEYMIIEGTVGISAAAFSYRSSLTSVTIPDSVTSIGRRAFWGCTGLQSVCFMGDAPTTFYRDAFKVWDGEREIYIPGLTLYYIEGKEGWTSPTWKGYSTATWDGVNLPHIHSYQVLVTAPTCTEQGYTTHTCIVCGDSYVDTYVDAMGHKYENGVCVQCGEKEQNEQPVIEFVDVPQKAWFVEAVNYAVQNGLMNGVGNDQFNPEGSMTRAMLVTVLWRYEGEPEAGENTFSDVPNGQWYTNAVAWAAENGIVGGVGNNRFDPNGEITREQMATILFRYAEKKGIDTSKRGSLNIFSDEKQLSAYAENPVKWAVAEQIINGSDGKLLPQGNATRAQVATILMRFIENNVKKS